MRLSSGRGPLLTVMIEPAGTCIPSRFSPMVSIAIVSTFSRNCFPLSTGMSEYYHVRGEKGSRFSPDSIAHHINLLGVDLPCYVLENGQRVVGRTSFTEMLTGIKAGGGLEKYLAVEPLKPFIPLDEVLEKMVPFRLPEVEGLQRHVKGLPADLLIDICKGFMAALEASTHPDSPYPKRS